MDFSLKEILGALGGAGAVVTGLFFGMKWVFERLDLGKAKKQTAEEKAYEAVWKMYEAGLKTIENQNEEIEKLKKGDSLARPTITKVYQAVRKLGRQIEILDSVFLKELFEEEITSEELQLLRDAVKREMEILRQNFEELETTLP